MMSSFRKLKIKFSRDSCCAILGSKLYFYSGCVNGTTLGDVMAL